MRAITAVFGPTRPGQVIPSPGRSCVSRSGLSVDRAPRRVGAKNAICWRHWDRLGGCGSRGLLIRCEKPARFRDVQETVFGDLGNDDFPEALSLVLVEFVASGLHIIDESFDLALGMGVASECLVAIALCTLAPVVRHYGQKEGVMASKYIKLTLTADRRLSLER